MSLSNNTQCGSINPGIVVAPNNTGSRVCGVTTSNTSALESCCGRDGDDQIHEYYCSHYCSTRLSLSKFVDCLIEEGGESEGSIVGANPYCQEGITSNTTDRLTSFGIPRARPRFGFLFWILVIGFMSAGQVLGAIVPSLSPNLQRRQSTSCSIAISHNYTTTRQNRLISGEFDCPRRYCVQNIPVDTGILNNNRTLNETSAAEPKYDTFFEVLQNQTMRKFPALSSVELNLDLVVNNGNFHVGFTPLAWCINGTVSNCGDVFGTDDSTVINACGPLFVSDYAASTSQGNGEDAMQGILAPIYH